MCDFEELVQSVHYCAESQCEICPRGDKPCGFIECKNKLADDIANVIKELLSAVPHWISVEERLPKRTNPLHARDTYLVRLESGCIKTLFYEYDNSDRCRPGMSPLFSEGWEKTAVPVTHWMPLPEPPKEVE